MRGGSVPVWTYLLALCGFAATHLSLAGRPGALLWGSGGLFVLWIFVGSRTARRLPRNACRAMDLLVANAILILAATYFAFGEASLRMLGQVLMASQVSRAMRRKGPRDLAVMHGTALAQVALAAFLTRDLLFLPLMAVTIFLGVAASLNLVGLQVERSSEVRLFVVRPGGFARRRALLGGLAVPGLLAIVVTCVGVALFVLLPRGYPFLKQELTRRNEVVDPEDDSPEPDMSPGSVIGFSANVSLGDIGRIKATPWQAFFVRLSDGRNPGRLRDRDLYFRGAVLDEFSGTEWSLSRESRGERRWYRTAGGPGTLPVLKRDHNPRVPSKVTVQDYEMVKTSSPVLPALDRVVSIVLTEELPRVLISGGSCFAAPGPHREGFRYRVISRVSRDPERPAFLDTLDAAQRARHLRVPDMPGWSRIRELALRIVGTVEEPEERARLLVRWLKENCSYTLLFRERAGANALETFLFETRAGHCEYFATALALLLRAVEVPSRLIAGYRGGQWLDAEEGYLVWQKDAHAWVEAFLPDRGWARLDPTPADPEAVAVPAGRVPGVSEVRSAEFSTEDLLLKVRDFGPRERSQILDAVGRGIGFVVREGFGPGRPPRPFPPPLLVLTVVAAVLGVGVAGIRRFRSRGGGVRGRRRGRKGGRRPEVSFYEEALRALLLRGVARGTSQSPREFLGTVRGVLGAEAPAFARITEAFERVRYGERSLTAAEVDAMRGLAASLTGTG